MILPICLLIMQAVACIAAFWKRQLLADFYTRTTWVRIVGVITLTGAAFICGFMAENLWSKANQAVGIQAEYWLWLANLCIAPVLVAGWKEWLSDESKGRFKKIEESHAALIEQRNALVEISTHIKRIIDSKLKRMSQIKSGEDIPPLNAVFKALGPEQQIRLIAQYIYEFIKTRWRLQPGAKLRLGIYTLSTEDPNRLFCGFSWDGSAENCFSENVNELNLVNSFGTQSVVVQCYHLLGNEKCIIIPDTSSDPAFSFFRAPQREYLKSMLAFKYIALSHKEKKVMIIAADSDQPGYFSPEFEEEYRPFLVEMCKRLEYEFQTMEAFEQLGAI